MKRRRKNQKREKMIMLCSSVLVLSALTVTGLYVKEKNQQQDDGYIVDLSKLEPQNPAPSADKQPKEDDSAQVSSSGVKNPSKLTKTEKTYEMPWDYSFVEEKEEEYKEEEEESLNFSSNDKLLWPIVGNVLINYSMENPVYFSTLDQYKCSPAIVIQAQEGQNVAAAADAEIIKIEKTEELGNVITMNAGNGYEIIYGQLTNMQVKEGDRVKRGDYIADVAAPTKYYSVEGSNIYFELKKDGTPQDPMMQLE